MLRHWIIILLMSVAALGAVAQTTVSGKVVEKETGEAVEGASVVLRDANGKIRKFATSGDGGKFSITAPVAEGWTAEVSMISFAKQKVALDGAKYPLTVALEPAAFQLKEVAVKAERIREQGDTITYSVGSFAQKQDRSIGDVLKRMPGIDVAKSGKIQYQGEDINKFYIEGSDLLGGRYGIATNGINHEDVGSVEVMENHQPMQVLSGLAFSEKAAINLKLKNRSKATWTFHGDAGAGVSAQPEGLAWDGELFAMAIMSSFQNITTLKTNNIGENLAAQANDFFSGLRNTDLSSYIGISLPGVPSLSSKRTLFNRSALLSTNNLWKLRRGEFKFNIDYSFNRVVADAANVTTYFLNSGNRVITENRHGVDRAHGLSGKFIYELNQKTVYIENTLKTDIRWDDISLSTGGTLPNRQSAYLPDYYVANKLKAIKRFNRGSKTHLITFNSHNEWESLPQTLRVSLDGSTTRQHVSDHAFYTDENVSYAFSVKGVTIGLEGGVKAYLRSMDSQLPDMPEELPGITDNVVSTNYVTLYAKPSLEYWVNRVNIRLGLPVSVARYSFDKAIADRSEAYFSPSLSFNWKPTNRLSATLGGGLGRSPMNLNLIHPGYIMTNYRTLNAGVDDFYNSSSQRLSANFSYRHTRRGFFGSARVMQSWHHTPYTMAQQLFGDYVVYSYTDAKNDSKSFMSMANFGKTLDFMRGSCNVNGSFSRSESQLVTLGDGAGGSAVRRVSTGWSVGAKIGGNPVRWLSFDYSFNHSANRLGMNSVNASWLGSTSHRLDIILLPHDKWQWRIGGDYYRNEITQGNYKDVTMLDTRLTFTPGKRIELMLDLNNILNRRTYNYTTYSELSSFESQRQLRGRELLLTLSVKK